MKSEPATGIDDLRAGLTLSYYSNRIENGQLKWKTPENRQLVKESFMEYAKTRGLEGVEETLLKMKGDPERIKKIIMGTKLPLPSLVGS